MKTYLIIRQRVREYTNWREAFDSKLEWRKLQGERHAQVFRDEKDPDVVTVLSEWEDRDSAKRFISDPELSESMQLSGVMEQPTVYFLYKD